MVSPLKTWQHQEPKGLWPALGGLALITHVGVLGLSLPYVLEMMQPSGASTAATIPIELIEVDPPIRSAEPATKPTAPSPEVKKAVTKPTADSTARPPRVEASEPVVATSSNSIPTSPTNPTPTAQPLPPQSEDNTQTGDTPAEPEIDTPITPSEGSPSTEDSDETPNDDGPEANTEETPSEPTTLSSDGPTLPSPEEAVGESDREQVAYLSLVSHSRVPNSDLLTDLADTPATPIYGAINGIELRPENVGCGKVDFVRSQVTYRVEISPQGTLRSATPWTGSIEPYSMSEEEKAISCLIVSAGFQFNPALKDGDSVANSNLLLTIDIIESGLN